MGFAFAFGGVYLNAVTGSKIEAKPATAEPEDPVVLLQRALLNDSASMVEAEERLRLLMRVGVIAAPPTAPDRGQVAAVVMLSNGTYKDQRNVRRLGPAGARKTRQKP
jgi:hypothetical protein